MKKMTRIAIRKALTSKSYSLYDLVPYWQASRQLIDDVASRYGLSNHEVSACYRELEQEGKVGSGAYQWGWHNLEFWIGEDPQYYFWDLFRWGLACLCLVIVYLSYGLFGVLIGGIRGIVKGVSKFAPLIWELVVSVVSVIWNYLFSKAPSNP